jgi:hypothetical protein
MIIETEEGAEMKETFEMNSKTYKTDSETLNVLRQIVPAARKANDYTAIAAVMSLGLATGRIVEVK